GLRAAVGICLAADAGAEPLVLADVGEADPRLGELLALVAAGGAVMADAVLVAGVGRHHALVHVRAGAGAGGAGGAGGGGGAGGATGGAGGVTPAARAAGGGERDDGDERGDGSESSSLHVTAPLWCRSRSSHCQGSSTRRRCTSRAGRGADRSWCCP